MAEIKEPSLLDLPDLAPAGLALLFIFGLLIWYDKPVESARPFDPYIQHQDLQTSGYSYESWLWQEPFAFDLDSYTERNQYYIEFSDKSEPALPHHFRIHKKTDVEPADRENEANEKKESKGKKKEAEAEQAESEEDQCEYQLKKRINAYRSNSGTSIETPTRNFVKILAPLLKVHPNTTENKEARTRQRYAVIAGLIESGYRPLEPERLHFCSSQKNKAYDVRWEHYQHESKYLLDVDTPGKNNTNQAEKNELSDKPDIIVVWINSEIFKTDDNALTLDKFASGFENLLSEETYIYDLNNILDLKYRDKITDKIKEKNCKSLLLVNPDGFYKKVPSEKLPEECTEKQAGESPEKPKEPHIIEELTKKLSEELTLRNVKEPSDVMIITEQDSESARTLAKNFCKSFSDPSVKDKQDTNAEAKPTADDPKDNICEIRKIRNIFYLKGLDAYQQTLHKQDKNEGQANKSVARLSAIDLDIPPPLPIGPGQFDYFHRLAKQTNDVHKEINLEKRDSGIRAVGIFGSDFYDKLLILEALRAEMPNVLVFTTDLDAQMLHPQHWASTRNLVVASHFNILPKEKDKDNEEQYQKQSCQQEFPIFRDSGQINIFYRTIEAITNGVTRFDIPLPKIFEIGRHGAVELDATQENEDCLHADDAQNASRDENSLQRLLQKFPRDQILLQQLPVNESKLRLWLQDQTNLLLSLLAGIIVFLVWFYWRIFPNSGIRTIYLFISTLMIFAIAFCVATESEEGLSFTEGISLWPSIFLQIIAILMAFAFFVLAKKELDENFRILSKQQRSTNCPNEHEWELSIGLGRIAGLLTLLIFSIAIYVLNDVYPFDFQFIGCLLSLVIFLIAYIILKCRYKRSLKRRHKDNIDFNRVKDWIEKDNPENACKICDKLRKCFKQRIEKDNPENTKSKGEKEKSQSGENKSEQECPRLWREYYHYGLISHRGSRVVAMWLFFAIIETILIYILPPWPLPCRGGAACSWASWASVLSFTFVMLLLFFILDAVRLNYYWVKKLRIQVSEQELNAFNDEIRNDLRSLENIVALVAERTSVVDKLIYYPMLCIMLMLFARITYFDNQDLPLSKAITFAVSISLLFFSGFMLRSEAEKLKRSVIECTEDIGKNNRRIRPEVEAVTKRIKGICDGAFQPMFEQPVMRALLIILASISLFASKYLEFFG